MFPRLVVIAALVAVVAAQYIQKIHQQPSFDDSFYIIESQAEAQVQLSDEQLDPVDAAVLEASASDYHPAVRVHHVTSSG
ncbi:Hypothetical predicted protein [Cloeon dipterum]|uniref:Uncharacterized protein n=1 Tax=Cloeon dipterum TaxID=197152 RepID=A0A8S1E9L5_9INSE|nr:Hypothetical predicted protein [Cloeon dipterum]